ncbi:MAG: hypothetical protein M1834_006832 [Cirrosporium novae-zelandiae]|nr:MAG: hypothetical protein M1834_006832 [Cirrosporium novae-zelandiae]
MWRPLYSLESSEDLERKTASLIAAANNDELFLVYDVAVTIKGLRIADARHFLDLTALLLAKLNVRSRHEEPSYSECPPDLYHCDDKDIANLEHLLLRLEHTLLEYLFCENMQQLEYILIRRHIVKKGWFTEWPDGKRPLNTTMPWNIKASLVVLWGVCWMFWDNSLRQPQSVFLNDPEFISIFQSEMDLEMEQQQNFTPTGNMENTMNAMDVNMQVGASQARRGSAESAVSTMGGYGGPEIPGDDESSRVSNANANVSVAVPLGIPSSYPFARPTNSIHDGHNDHVGNPGNAGNGNENVGGLYVPMNNNNRRDDLESNALGVSGNRSSSGNLETAAPTHWNNYSDIRPDTAELSSSSAPPYAWTAKNHNSSFNIKAENSPAAYSPVFGVWSPRELLYRQLPSRSSFLPELIPPQLTIQPPDAPAPQEFDLSAGSTWPDQSRLFFERSPSNSSVAFDRYSLYQGMGVDQQGMEYPTPASPISNGNGTSRRASSVTTIEDDMQQDENSVTLGKRPRAIISHRRPEQPPRREDGSIYCNHQDCQQNPPTFRRPCEWNKHMDKHDRPYKCTEPGCSKMQGFTYSGGLLRHMREVHMKDVGQKKRLMCPFSDCNRSTGHGFTRKENLNEHLRRRHANASEIIGNGGEAVPFQSPGPMPPASIPLPMPQVAPMSVGPTPPRKRKRDELDDGNNEDDIEVIPEGGWITEVKRLRKENEDKERRLKELETVVENLRRQMPNGG